MNLDYQWRGDISDEELFLLTQSHGGRPSVGWWDRIRPYSLGWISARQGDGSLIGFVNVAWDGCDHAFLLDPKVGPITSMAALALNSYDVLRSAPSERL